MTAALAALERSATKERTPDTITNAGSCETDSTSVEIEPRLMSVAAASAIRVGPIRPAIVFGWSPDPVVTARHGLAIDYAGA
jgi:hypothetical protein